MNKFDLLSQYYPASILSGVGEAYTFVKQNNLNQSKNFSFNAYNKDTLQARKIFILIIGESSQYNRWAINGYNRQTTPKLSAMDSLYVFQHVVAGCNLTWMSVPQIITRAEPDRINLQFSEKSIISAFKDAHFKTAWLSNQSDKEIFWSGTIVLHAKTADFATFSPTQSPNFETEDYYDERLLPLMDSIIASDNKNVFIVLHTMGNHWDYSKRYPKQFDYFKPSGLNHSVDPTNINDSEAISNSYDNSIRYADYIIDSVIKTVNKYHAVSSVTFLSDHGEDLYNNNKEQLDFHLQASKITLHVPCFTWLSPEYKNAYRQKSEALISNLSKQIGPQCAFYTFLDMANVSYAGFDSTKSFANKAFIEMNRVTTAMKIKGLTTTKI